MPRPKRKQTQTLAATAALPPAKPPKRAKKTPPSPPPPALLAAPDNDLVPVPRFPDKLGSPSDAPANTTFPDKLEFPASPPGTDKIVSWNVAGIAASTKKGFLKYITAEDADIICLQETKLNGEPDDNTWVPLATWPYQYWSHCTAKKGYSGTAVVSKIKPLDVGYGMPEKTGLDFDNEGRLIWLEFETYYLVASYVPNAGNGLVRLTEKMTYNSKLEAYIRKLQEKKPVIWAGDLNVAHKEIDLARPKTNHKTAGFTPEERADFDRILSTKPNFIDSYRHFHPDVVDRYTYYGYRFNCRSKNLGWRLDYFVVSESLLPKIEASEIRSQVYGASDHVPIMLLVKK
ncbi:DNA-apurinic or apyrimidinic site lyase [Blyttiomyces helicus]|uniref:DNA repair nuclease/redox regulator APEX1 n=1 Tax=Blyttiomyces helicus TaxID=388810 RepID=A0A4P9WJE9_9FUNG|nr:DNA-apurinic or apyrimidinic site lyase [Blyttiomyces helicus]|eukprot:RKO91618.1 DNA-apurinic or apyrimidinic site lyase [Blyttiomyces helicus]